MSETTYTQSVWQAVEPMLAGLAWAVPVALWIGVALSLVSGDASVTGLLLLLPALVAVVVMVLITSNLMWPARVVAGLAGFGIVSAVVIIAMPASVIMDALLAVLIPLSWLGVGASTLFGHAPVVRVLADRTPRIRFVPLGAWIALVSLWFIIQASPDSAMATDGPFLEVNMLTIAGITGLLTALFTTIAARVTGPHRTTTKAARIR